MEVGTLTPDGLDEQSWASQAFVLHKQVLASLAAGRAAAWDLAKSLHEFNELAGWAALGYDSLNAYLADDEVGIKRSTYFRLTQLWRELHVRHQVSEEELKQIDSSKASVVLPTVAASPARLQQALSDAKKMGKSDLREEYLGTNEQGRAQQRAQSRADGAGPTGWTDVPALGEEVTVETREPATVITEPVVLSTETVQHLVSQANSVLGTAGRRELIAYVEEVRDVLLR